MLVNAREMIKKAYDEKYAIAHININNLEWAKSVLEVAQETNTPVILGLTEGAAKYQGGFKTVVGMVNGLLEDLNITVPVALHLDHGTTVEVCIKAMDAGLSSIMYDGSHESIDVNVANTKIVVEYAKARDISVEAEVGTVGGTEDGVTGGVKYASLDEVKLIAATGIDFLAASLGSVHGNYDGEPELGFAEMEQYSAEANIPLVLHGGSGIPLDMIQKAIKSGEAKINVNTALQKAFSAAVIEYIEAGSDQTGVGYDPRKVLAGPAEAIKKVTKETFENFGSIGKA